MAIKIKSTKDVASHGVKAVIYGPSGVGKTRLLADLENAIIISSENGLLSLADTDIPYIEVATLRDMQEAYQFVKNSEYQVIALDSLSEIAEVVLNELKKDQKDPRRAYAELAEAFGAMIRHFRDLAGKDVIMIAKEKPLYDEMDSVIGYVPLLPGKVLPHGLPYLVDELFAYYIDNRQRRVMLTQADRKRQAKDRSGKLPPQIVNPNLQTILNAIKGDESSLAKLG